MTVAFGVIYNIARIQLSESARELAGLRVLGFTAGEASRVALTELGVLVRGQMRNKQEVADLAYKLAGLGLPLIVHQPPELRDELRRLARHTAWLAERTAG